MLVAGLHFTGTVDPTAAATVVLALVTGASLILTGRSLKYTEAALEQTQEEIEESHRPVVVPVVDATQRLKPDRSDSPTIGPQLVSRGVLWIPIENVGSGPALNIEVTIAMQGDSTAAPAEGTIAGLGAERRLPVEVKAPNVAELGPFAIAVAYHDVGGKRWITTATYAPTHHRYETITIAPVDEDTS